MLSYLSLGAICYIAGIYICDFFPSERTDEVTAVCVLIGAVLLIVLRKYRKYTLWAMLFLCMGILGCSVAEDLRYNDFYELNEKYVTIEGYVTDLPEQHGDLYSYKVKTTGVQYLDREYKAGQIIKASSYVSLNYGDNIRISGFLEELSDKKNGSDFNVKRYYQSRGIFYRMYARELALTGLNKKDHSLTYWLNLYKSKMADIIDNEFSGDESAVLKAIALGNKRQFSAGFKNLLIETGMMKFFYPSFLHIFLISAIIAIIFGKLKKASRDYIFIAFMIIYAAVNTHSPVFVKNAVMVILGILILKKFGFSHKPNILSLAVLIICFSNPLYCFDVGFVMSVSSGCMIYYFKDILESLFSFIPFRAVRKFLGFYIITTFGLLPITAYYFNGISLYTNLLSPLYLVVVAGLLILVFVMCILSALFGTTLFITAPISWLLWYFTSLPEIIKKLPFSHVWIKPQGFIFTVAFFATLYLIYQTYMKDIKKTRNMIVLFCCAGLWCSVLIGYITSKGEMDITFVNVGQGDGMVININGGETLLIDGGGKYEFSDYDAGEQIFAPYLADNGYFNIDKAFVTHYHSDHCLGVIAAMKLVNVKEVVMPDYDKENKYRMEIEQIAEEKNIKITYAAKGDVIDFDSGMAINILSPDDRAFSGIDENEFSLVMQLEYNGFRCLFTGDISAETEQGLLEYVSDCDVVKMSHHGSANSNCKEFADAVKAEYAIVSVGEDNIYGFPKKEAVYNYQQSGAKVARTDVNGDITVKVDSRGRYKVYKNSK